MKNNLLKMSFFCLAITLTVSCKAHPAGEKEVVKSGMRVRWHYKNERVFFEMSGPSSGWVAIAFNTGPDMTGAYLLMGRVVDGKAELVEHYTSAPGNYGPITMLGAEAQVADVDGSEKGEYTAVSFSLPVKALSKYQRDLNEGLSYTMTLAYSREDDFQHHSMMRTWVAVVL
ncbi:MAG: DOMON domain-containing protein [Bacteroidia bacterium]